jgi:23S rRNA (uracil1939-C5)-methyltransferase
MKRPRRQPRETAGPRAETRELAIGSIGAEGDGVAEGPVFTPLTLPGELVRASVAGERAELIEVLRLRAAALARRALPRLED